MLPYNKMRLMTFLCLCVCAIGGALSMASPAKWGRAIGICLIALGASEYGRRDEEWKYRDVRDYLRREGLLR